MDQVCVMHSMVSPGARGSHADSSTSVRNARTLDIGQLNRSSKFIVNRAELLTSSGAGQ